MDIEELLTQLHTLLGPKLYQLILNPRTNRPLLMKNLKQKRAYKNLSGGERVLVHLAYDIYNGSGKLNISNLYFLDTPARVRAINALEYLTQVHRP